MVYINHILKKLSLVFCLLGLNEMPGLSQTCCSGGVPLSGNICFEGAAKGTLQTEWSYNLNYLATLKNGTEIFEDEGRQRITHSFLFKLGYSNNNWFAIDALFSYVLQERKIFFNEQTNHENAHGPGDAVLMAKFILSSISKKGSELQLGLGPKLPLGSTNRANKNNILLNADMQPGPRSSIHVVPELPLYSNVDEAKAGACIRWSCSCLQVQCFWGIA